MSATAQERLTQLWETPHTLWGELTTVDHKKLGKRYLATAFCFLIIGGLEALVMRLQLARPNQGMLDPETYYQIFTMHGVTMIFWYAQPILSGFAIYLIPLMIGARDLVVPPAECLHLLDISVFGTVSLWKRPFLRGPARRLVRLCPAYRQALLARSWGGFLCSTACCY